MCTWVKRVLGFVELSAARPGTKEGLLGPRRVQQLHGPW